MKPRERHRKEQNHNLQSWTLWHVLRSSGFKSTWHKLLTWSSFVRHCTDRCMTPTPQVTEHCKTEDRFVFHLKAFWAAEEQRQMVSFVSRDSSKASNPAKCSNTGLIFIKQVIPFIINPFIIILVTNSIKTNTELCFALKHFTG